MNREDILSGKAGMVGIQQALNGQSSRRLLRKEAQEMLRQGYRAGSFHLTRAKFKPERKLSAYFTFPALNTVDNSSHSVYLAVTWQKTLDGADHADSQSQLQEEADQSGLMPVQKELWRNIIEQGIKLQVWPLDIKFPQLVRLGNPSYAAAVFASLGSAPDLQSLPVVPPIRYRPAERHVLRYEISSHKQEQRLYAKPYSSAQDAARAFGVANRVVDWLAAHGGGLQGIRPAAISQEDSAIIYPHAPGIPLSHQLHRSRRWVATQLQTIGRGLSILHNGPASLQADIKQ